MVAQDDPRQLSLTFFNHLPTLGERAQRAWRAYSLQDKQYALKFGPTWEALGPERQACWLAAAAAVLAAKPSS